jgi:hypothetical protein
VLVYIGEVAGMESVAIIHGTIESCRNLDSWKNGMHGDHGSCSKLLPSQR